MKALLPLTLALFIGMTSLAQEPKQKGLDFFVGKDLRQLDDRSRDDLSKQFEALTGHRLNWEPWSSPDPWWIKPFVSGDAAWIFLEAYPGYDIPDVSRVQIHVFDKNWKHTRKQSFLTGYRFFLNEVVLSKENPLGQELLVAKVTSSGPFLIQGEEKRPAFERGNYQRQYYAFLRDQFVMVRLEDDKKELVQNHYRWRSPPKGPPVPKRTCEEWIRSLSSEAPVEQLATLVWLSGMHLTSAEKREENVNQESGEDSKLIEAVRDAAETREALLELANSRNSWVKEYATLTLQRNR